MIYLDNAATSFVKPIQVERNVLHAMRYASSPGRGGYKSAMNAAEIVFACREAAAELFNVAESDNVVFTMNATHALNIAINSIVKAGDRVVISGFEHNSASRPVYAKTDNVRIAGRKLFDPGDTLKEFEALVPDSDAVVCTYVSNAFGYILPIYEIADICRHYAVPLIVDASQAAGILPIDFERLGAAFVAMPGHKSLFGPQGTGILLCKNVSKPLMYGGSGSFSRAKTMPDFLPDRLEAGTQNVCGIAGLLAGIEYVAKKRLEIIDAHERMLLKFFIDELKNERGIRIFCADNQTQCGVISLQFKSFDSEYAAEYLADKGICVRAGIQCAPTAHESAGTLEKGTVRFSFSPFNTVEEIKKTCSVIKELIN